MRLMGQVYAILSTNTAMLTIITTMLLTADIFAPALAAMILHPSEPFGDGYRSMALTDVSWLDAFAPTPEDRSIADSAFFPTSPSSDCDWNLIPLYSSETATI